MSPVIVWRAAESLSLPACPQMCVCVLYCSSSSSSHESKLTLLSRPTIQVQALTFITNLSIFPLFSFNCQTDPFTNWELQNPSHDVSEPQKALRFPNLEALIVKGSVGCFFYFFFWEVRTYVEKGQQSFSSELYSPVLSISLVTS